MKEVPFYPNHGDDMHCMLAVYASIFDYFLNKKLTWKELEKFTGFNNGKAAWTVEALPKMAEMGFDIKMIEPFDYSRYLKEGEGYLKEFFTDEELKWHYDHSNIREMKKSIPVFQELIKHQMRRATLKDIDKLLAEDRLVFITVNSRALNNKPGFTSHALLIIRSERGNYIAHDPGSPPRPFRSILPKLLWKAMGGKNNTAEVTGFKLAKRAAALK